MSWMRGQSGMTSLRAILYMDEIFGYFPPVSNPPSKQPLLTLLKQARAFGIGVVLASQNPVDLDYKGLANTGTWFIGRLQTERDKMRVIDGLEGAAAESGSRFDRAQIERTLSALGQRIFLVNNVHADHQEIIESRWSLSYLRGPLTKSQIKDLMSQRKSARTAADSTGAATTAPGAVSPAAAPAAAGAVHSGAAPSIASLGKPALPPEIPEYFLPATTPGDITYRPMLLGFATLRFTDSKTKLDHSINKAFLTEIDDDAEPVNWNESVEQRIAIEELLQSPARPGAYVALPAAATKAANYKQWSKDFAAWLSSSQKFYLLLSPSTGQLSQPNESERQFRIRLNDAATQARDRIVEELRAKYAPKVKTLQDKIMQGEQRLQREMDEEKERDMQAAISIGATILGAFTGRKPLSTSTISRAST
ncbi:MAG: hypothetical protein ACRD3W_17635, partial [Terriglobales bacterium]